MLPCGLSKTNKNQTVNNGASPRISTPSSRDHGELVASALTDGKRQRKIPVRRVADIGQIITVKGVLREDWRAGLQMRLKQLEHRKIKTERLVEQNLVGTGSAVQQVADGLGYESASSFVSMFRKALGTSPGRYMAERRMRHA